MTNPLVTYAGEIGFSGVSSKQVAPSADRNKDAIFDVLKRMCLDSLPAPLTLLEIASGTGQHAFHIVENSHITVQPSDVSDSAFASIEAYRLESTFQSRFLAPFLLDVRSSAQLRPEYDAVLCVNMIHISPPECTPGLLDAALAALRPGGLLFLYGPFLIDGVPTTESNAAFDAKLKGMDPSYGLKDAAVVVDLAAARGLVLQARLDMPANNFMLVFKKE